jgi:flagellar M-ring protein FliF
MLNPALNNLSNFWTKLSPLQRVMLVVLVLAVGILIPVLINWASTPTYVVAYSGLSEIDAGQIVQNLTESNTPYQLKNASTILVPSDKVYEVRLQMARDGLPAESTVGFELFDANTLGMNEFTQRVNYQRALEGELERTIGSLSAVSAVQVHLVTPEKSLLTSNQAPVTASVTLTEAPGNGLDKAQIRAIANLVASSVEGLKPENVVLVDSNGILLSSGTGGAADASQTDSQRAAEIDAANEIDRNIKAMLDKILGPQHSTVKSNVTMDWTQREITSNTYDPTPAAVRSSQKTNETYTTNGEIPGGIPGASSNLPTPVAQATGVPGVTNYARMDETINYEISMVESHEITSPGKISRITVSVMVDQVSDPQQLESIKSAVMAAAGIDTTRGDEVVVESLAFDTSYLDQQETDAAQAQQEDLIRTLVPVGLAALGFLILLILVLRTFSKMHKASKTAWQPVLMPVQHQMALNASAAQEMLQLQKPELPQLQVQALQHSLAAAAAAHQQQEEPAIEITRNTAAYQEDEKRTHYIKKLTEESPSTVAEIIQVWLSEDTKRND